MDRVRFGRALGYGVRHAAKTAMQAVEAATAPDPNAGRAQTSRAADSPDASPAQEAVRSVAEAHRTVTQARSQVRGAAKGAAKSMFAPLAKFSGVLWLEVTGVFFALIAAFIGQGIWKLRGAMQLPPGSHDAQRLYLHVVLFLLFVYFAVTSFVRARRRERH